MPLKTMLRVSVILATASLLCACGQIQKQISSEASLLDKAEFATGVSAANLKIVEGSVTAELDSVHYKVKAKNGTLYRCYFTSIVATTSDAICTAIDGSGKAMKNQKKKAAKGGNCNDLLRAAGRC